MAKDITIGIEYRDKEVRSWQKNFEIKLFVPGSRSGKTCMINCYILSLWLNISGPTDGRTKLFKFKLTIQI